MDERRMLDGFGEGGRRALTRFNRRLEPLLFAEPTVPELLLVALEMLLTNLIEHGSQQLVGDYRALIDAPVLWEGASWKLDIAVADADVAVGSLEHLHALAACGFGALRWLEDVHDPLVVQREVTGDAALLLPLDYVVVRIPSIVTTWIAAS